MGISLQVDMLGEQAMLDTLARFDQQAASVLQPWLSDVAEETMGAVRDNIEPHSRTGVLLDSIQAQDSGPLSFTIISTDMPVAGWMEYGTPAHVIEPRNARVLRFVVGSGVAFARRVSHPGTRPYLLFQRAAESIRARVPEFLADLAERLKARGL